MGWFEDLKNRIWLETRKALRNKSVLTPPAVPATGAPQNRGGVRRFAGRIARSPITQGGFDFGVRVASGEDPVDAGINVGAGMSAAALASKANPIKHPAVQFPVSLGAYLAASNTADWLNQNVVKPMLTGVSGEQRGSFTDPRYGPTGAPLYGVGGGNAGASVQPALGPTSPVQASTTPRPVPSTNQPSRAVVPSSPPAPVVDDVQRAVESELLAKAAQQRTDDLVRQMTELGVTGGMTPENMRKWVGANVGLADRLIQDRLGREARLAKEFAGFSGYPQ